MGKTLTYKSGYNTSNIINRSDIGDLSDNGDGTINATNATTTDVRNALGEDNNNIGLLCSSNNVNMWALFKPGYVSIDANKNLFFAQPTDSDGYKLGDFLGYNHNAGKPTVPNTNRNYTEDDTTITIQVLFNQYELNWDEIPNVSHFWVKIMEGSTERVLKSFQIDYSDRNQILDTDLDVTNDSKDKTLEIEVWVGNSTQELAIVDSGTLTLNYLEKTDFAGIAYSAGSGYIPDWDDESINATDDTFTIDIYLRDNNMNRVSETVDIDVYVNSNYDHTKTNVYIDEFDSGGTTVTGTFQNGINKYGDTWSLVLT